MSGKLILVVGPSGAGKDTLLAAAAERLDGDRRFAFPRRLITRTPHAHIEDHLSLSWAQFENCRKSGDYTLAWEAHGLGYIIPAEVKQRVATGTVAVCNASRSVIPTAVKTVRNCAVIVIDAEREIRARRLYARGRETLDDINARLTREGAPLPPGIEASTIDNSGTLTDSIDAFCKVLEDFARTARSADLTV